MKKRDRVLAALLVIMMLIIIVPVAALVSEPDEPMADAVLETVGIGEAESHTDSEAPKFAVSQLPAFSGETSFSVDYTGKLPDELKAVPVKEIFAGSGYTLKDTDKISYSAISRAIEWDHIPCS